MCVDQIKVAMQLVVVSARLEGDPLRPPRYLRLRVQRPQRCTSSFFITLVKEGHSATGNPQKPFEAAGDYGGDLRRQLDGHALGQVLAKIYANQRMSIVKRFSRQIAGWQRVAPPSLSHSGCPLHSAGRFKWKAWPQSLITSVFSRK